jgi:TatD DNase family protein
MIDTHTHLFLSEFDGDRELIFNLFEDNSIEAIISVGYNYESSKASAIMSYSKGNVYASVGIHPHDSKDCTIDKIEELLKMDKVVAIGEIGLDYYRNLSPKEDQINCFERQLDLYFKYKKPLILHIRDAYSDAYKILKKHSNNYEGVVHAFDSDFKTAKKFLELGFHIGIGGMVTYKKKDYLREAVKNIPISKILLETDCPYLSPVPVRGKRNEPANLKYVIETISIVKKINQSEVDKQTTSNAKLLFGIR